MEVAYSTEFERQRVRFTFRFTCEHCTNFDDERETCLHGYPCEMHRLSFYETDPPPTTILFCKEFDLA